MPASPGSPSELVDGRVRVIAGSATVAFAGPISSYPQRFPSSGRQRHASRRTAGSESTSGLVRQSRFSFNVMPPVCHSLDGRSCFCSAELHSCLATCNSANGMQARESLALRRLQLARFPLSVLRVAQVACSSAAAVSQRSFEFNPASMVASRP